MEAVLSAADKHGVRFFVGDGFYGDWESPHIVTDPVAARKRLQAIEELTQLYSHHPSFYGWYWPNEASINQYYAEEFIHYVNTCSRLARRLTPKAKILIAPYGTRVAVPDDKYVRQLDSLDVDIIAYQDEVGVRKSTVEETPRFYERLRKAHDRSRRSEIWATSRSSGVREPFIRARCSPRLFRASSASWKPSRRGSRRFWCTSIRA